MTDNSTVLDASRAFANSKAGLELSTCVRRTWDLSRLDRQQMYQLMADHYVDADPHAFERDLNEKEWVIVTSDSRRGILGFTTLKVLTADVGTERVSALYSGDTALDPDIWGSGSWVRVWGRHATKIVQSLQPGPVLWLLLTATHRTYRFLPTFFREYYPRSAGSMPAVDRRRLDALMSLKFSREYDREQGIVHAAHPLVVRPVRVAMATEGMDDDDGQFFASRNPGYLNGDYLVCTAELTPRNYTRLGRKLFLGDTPI